MQAAHFRETFQWLVVRTTRARTAGSSYVSQQTRTSPWLMVRTMGLTNSRAKFRFLGDKGIPLTFVVRTTGGRTARSSYVSQHARTSPWLMVRTTGGRTAGPSSGSKETSYEPANVQVVAASQRTCVDVWGAVFKTRSRASTPHGGRSYFAALLERNLGRQSSHLGPHRFPRC
ncbi:uncharacterized protein [Dermacentor albipictus]|uniref:uncharacterized protein isoform X6 n=1 Tax=Dermacentor albipictus TaxID=60249 RepID=UPI0031FCA396